MLEFFTSEDGSELFVKSDKGLQVLNESNIELINPLYEKIKTDYTEAYEAMMQVYGTNRNIIYHKYLFVRRFLKCNFSRHDSIADVNDDFTFNLETVYCPMRGECKWDGIICNAQITNELTQREKEIVKLMAENYQYSEIADMLFISAETVKKHGKNILRKLNLKNKAAVMQYVKQNKI